MNIDPTLFAALSRVLTGLHEYTIVAAEDTPNSLTVRVVASALSAPCPSCGEFSTAVKGVRAQVVRDVAHGGRAVLLIVSKRSFRCTADWCERKTFTQQTNEIAARRRTTSRCREQIGRAAKDRSTASVAREYGVSWSTAWTAIRHVAVRELALFGRQVPAVIGIDETRFWWREPWLTGIVNLANSDLIEMVCGRSSQTLREWVSGLTDVEREGVRTVVIDLHAGYRAAISEVLPNAVIVGDRFHFEQIGGRALTDVRRRRIWEQASHRGRKIDPGWRARHDLLRRPDRLTTHGWNRVIAAIRTDGGEALDGDLLWAWGARQYFGEIYTNAINRAHAHRMLIWWYCWIAQHPVPELVRFATTVSAWENEFLAFFDDRVTNGRTEGRNRTIKHVKRLGYGYRSTTNYILKCRYQALRLTSWTEPAKQPQAASIA